MTINIADNSPRANYTATSGQTVFTVSFEFFDEADLTVYINGTETSAYTVTGGDGSTGTVTLTSGATAGDKIAIVRDVAIERTTDFTEGAAISRSALNEQLDKLTAQVADINDRASRSLQLNDHEVAASTSLPATDDRKGKVLGFNEVTGDVQSGPSLTDVQSLADVSADIATLADIEDGTDATDAIQTAASISSDITTVSGISSNVTTVAGISSDVTAVAADATDIGTVATNISSVNTVATNIADVITVANDLNEAVSEVVTVADDLNEAVSEIDTVAGSISNVDTVGTNIADVNTVAGISANVTTVAGISANTTTVAGISANVTTVAGISSDVTAVAADATDIGTVATSISNVNAVAGNATNINAVAGNATNINTVASDSVNIGTVAGISANVSTVAGLSSSVSTLALISSDITTVAGISANVTTVAGDTANIATIATNLNGSDSIGTVATNISNVNAVGADISNVNTVATNLTSINSFAATYRIGTTDPTTSLDAGDLFYNTTSGTLKVYSGTGWEQGVTAGSGFLPLSGGTLTGNLVFSGTETVDGRDVSVDGTKLDGIEAGADVTDAANVEPLVDAHINVSGATSGQYLGWNGSDYAWSTVDLSTKLDLAGGTMTGALVLNADPSAALGAATKQYVDTEVAGIVDSAPATLDTLNELAAALGDDPNFATTVTNSIATKLSLSGGTLTGGLTGTSATFSGNALVGTTSAPSTLLAATSGGGLAFDAVDDYLVIAREGSNSSKPAIRLNQTGVDGDIAEFRKDGSTVGTIGTQGGDLWIGTGDTAAYFWDGSDAISPWNASTNTARDAAISLGTSSVRYKDGYFSNNLYMGGALYHDGDTDTAFYFGTDIAAIRTGGTDRIYVDNSGVRIGDTGNAYVQPVTGDYGSIQIDGGSHGGWEGYSIGGRVVLMHDNSIGAGIYNDANNHWMVYTALNGQVELYYAGNKKFQTTSSGITVTGDVNSTSDIRYKKNIETIDSALEKVQSLRGVTFDWDHEDFNSDSRATGVIAQDVEKVLPEAVRENEDGFKNVAYGNMVGLLIEAIKEQQEQIDALKEQLNS